MSDDSSPDPQKPTPSTGSGQAGLTALWAELKRRHVVRVAMVYAIVGWLVIQVANATFSDFGIPVWAYRFVVLMVVLGFPISVVLAWAFELTPQGIKTTKVAQKETEVTEDSGKHAKKRNWFSLAFAAAMPTLIFGALALFFYFRSSPDNLDHSSPALSSSNGLAPSPASLELAEFDKSIAVLPLANLSPDPENAFFADGVHEDILTNLAKVQSFKVISRSSVLRFRDNRPSMREMAEELRCNYIVEGSVRRAGNKVLVTVQLIDSRDDTHLWAENYERELVDIFAIQSAIAREIADQLQAKLSPREMANIDEVPTTSVKAYDYFLKARAILQSEGGFHNPPIISQAVELLESAIIEDQNFLQAWVQLVKAYSNLFQTSDDSLKKQLLNKAQNALARAKAINTHDPWTRFAACYYQYRVERDYPAALKELTGGGALPRLAEFVQMEALISRRTGFMDRALKLNQEALELDSGNVALWREQSENLFAMRRFKESAQATMRASFLEPQDLGYPTKGFESEFLDRADVSLVNRFEDQDSEEKTWWLHFLEHRKLGYRALELRGDSEKLKSYAASPTTPVDTDSLFLVFALLAENEAQLARTWAERILMELEKEPSQSRVFYFYKTTFPAVIHHLLGEPEKGKAILEQVRETIEEEKDAMDSASYRPYLILSLQYMDPDEAAEMMIQELEEPISFLSLDAIAAFHWSFRNLIIHRRIQPLIVAHENGKWLDYLSERVPEYAKYKKQ